MSSVAVSDLRAAIEPFRRQLDFDQIDLSMIANKTTVGDGTSAYLLSGRYVVILSPKAFPEVAEHGARQAAEAKAALYPAADNVVLTSLAVSRTSDGRTFSISQRCKPIDANPIAYRLHNRSFYAERVLRWLEFVLLKSKPPSEVAWNQVVANLSAMTEEAGLPEVIRTAASLQLRDLDASAFQPRFVPMHGDLWSGNIMLLEPRPFVVIDWRGFMPDGYPIYDLVRMAESFHLRPAALRDALTYHADRLETDLDHTAVYLLAALGHLLRNLGQFPKDRFARLATRCWATWSKAAEV